MLKLEYGALYKQMPEGNFRLHRDVYEKLHAQGALTDRVDQSLRSHLALEKP
jgi:hypothetical protein